MIKKIHLLLLMLSISFRVFAQQDPMYSQYIFNGLLINPAYAGTHEVLNATILYRKQWVNIPGAPGTGIFSIDSPVRNQKIGLGLNVGYDKIGITSHTWITGIYAYKLRFSQSSLTFGLQAGVGFFYSNNTLVKYSENAQNDVAFQTDYNETLPNFGLGMYYHTTRFFAGFSIPQILGPEIQQAIYGNQRNDLNLALVNHYFLSAGYLFDLTPYLSFQSSILVKYVDGVPIAGDLNGILWFSDILALGLSYRSEASVGVLGQIKISRQLFLGYAYEYSTTQLRNFTSGTHEIVLRYQFDFSRGKIVTPRFF
jgi:type IX secretion system PorP/SprF family membrane protein